MTGTLVDKTVVGPRGASGHTCSCRRLCLCRQPKLPDKEVKRRRSKVDVCLTSLVFSLSLHDGNFGVSFNLETRRKGTQSSFS